MMKDESASQASSTWFFYCDSTTRAL